MTARPGSRSRRALERTAQCTKRYINAAPDGDRRPGLRGSPSGPGTRHVLISGDAVIHFAGLVRAHRSRCCASCSGIHTRRRSRSFATVSLVAIRCCRRRAAGAARTRVRNCETRTGVHKHKIPHSPGGTARRCTARPTPPRVLALGLPVEHEAAPVLRTHRPRRPERTAALHCRTCDPTPAWESNFRRPTPSSRPT